MHGQQGALEVHVEQCVNLAPINDTGVSIYGFKLDLRLNSPDSEYEYAFNVCEALGANQLTMELPNDPATTKRIGEYAAKRKIWAGYHGPTRQNRLD